MNRSRFTIVAMQFFLAAVFGCAPKEKPKNVFPRRPIKVIVPFAAGGGSDTFGRIIQSAIEQQQLLPEKMVIVNVSGAGGTIGSRRVKNARPDGYTILLLHEAIMTAKYSGQAAYGPEAFTAIAGSGDAMQVVAVSGDSPFQNLTELLDETASRPDSIVFSANIGAPSHFAGLMLEQQREGARFRYTQTGGGAKRFAALQGGHVDVTSFSIAEYMQFQSAGVRALALLGAERHPELPDLATARQQGFDVISQNMQFWWAPADTSPERIEVIATAIEAAMKTKSVREKLAQMRMEPRFLNGDALAEEIESRSQRIAAVSSRKVDGLPNYPLVALGMVVAFGALALGQSRVGHRSTRTDRNAPASAANNQEPIDSCFVPDQGSTGRGKWICLLPALIVMAVTLAYVFVLQSTGIGFRAATFAFVMALGVAIHRFAKPAPENSLGSTRFALVLCGAALLLSIGVHFLFTQVLVVDLP